MCLHSSAAARYLRQQCPVAYSALSTAAALVGSIHLRNSLLVCSIISASATCKPQSLPSSPGHSHIALCRSQQQTAQIVHAPAHSAQAAQVVHTAVHLDTGNTRSSTRNTDSSTLRHTQQYRQHRYAQAQATQAAVQGSAGSTWACESTSCCSTDWSSPSRVSAFFGSNHPCWVDGLHLQPE